MGQTVGQARSSALASLQVSDYPGALRAYGSLLQNFPGDLHLRFAIAEVVTRLGMTDESRQLLRTVGAFAVPAGYPLLAIVAAHAQDTAMRTPILAAVADAYGAGSPRLGSAAARPNAPDLEAIIADFAADPTPLDAVVDRCLAQAANTEMHGPTPAALPPIPLLSGLARNELFTVLQGLRVLRFKDREIVMRQGDPGRSLYLVAEGELVVFQTDAAGKHQELARLREGNIFGEMALLTDQPRSASVAVIGEAVILEFEKSAMAKAAAQLPSIAENLDRYARERLVKNLMATSSLFRPFAKEQQVELLKRLEGIEYGEDAVILAENGPGTGLFIVLTGEVEVSSSESGKKVVLAHLHSGDMFGEMSLLSSQPTSATVISIRPSTLLFLHRDIFASLVAGVPALRSVFEAMARTRFADRGAKLATPPPAPPQEAELEIEILI